MFPSSRKVNMAKKKTKKAKSFKKRTFKAPSFKINSQQKLIFGSLLIILGILLFLAFLSFLFSGNADQSILTEFTSRDIKADNWLNKSGAWLSDFFINRGFGISSFIFSGLLFLSGVYVLMDGNKSKLRKHWIWGTLIVIWVSILFGFLATQKLILGGTIGFELNTFLQDYIGKIGTALLLAFGLISYLAIRFKVTAQTFGNLFKSAKRDLKDEFNDTSSSTNKEPIVVFDNNLSAEAEDIKSAFEIPLDNLEPTIANHSNRKDYKSKTEFKVETPKEEIIEPEVKIEIEAVKEEISETDNLANKLVEDFGQFDPTLELSNYQFPKLDLLKKYNTESITINQEELEDNKNRIVETLNNYKIGISSIKATIGPTVTLYEIVPEAGIRISKNKN